MIQRNNSANLDDLIINYIYSYYVKYDKLAQLINSQFYNSKSTELYIYIDLQDLLRHLDTFITKSKTPINNPLILTSGIINMVAHYRNFFATRYRCTTKFWIIDSVDNIIAKKICREFKTKPLSPNMCQLYTTNTEFLGSLCNYILNVQYEKTEVDFITKVIHINEIENRRKDPSILITKDPFAFQICMIPTMYVLKPKKSSQGDISVLINGETAVWNYIASISKKPQIKGKIQVEQLSLFMALSRVPSRYLKNLFNINGAETCMYNAYLNKATRDYIWDLNQFEEIFMKGNRGRVKTFDEIRYRYLACEAVRYQYTAYKSLPESKLYSGIVNLYDPKGVQEINNTYFKSCPLDLNVL